MTIFELVKIALDELYADGRREYGDNLDDRIRETMKYLSRSYGQLNLPNRTPVDYSDPATRFAYVYKYTAAHGDYLVQVLEMLRDQLGSQIFAGRSVRISCVGGGPGSDIIGFLKFLDENGNNKSIEKVTCYLLDKEQAWADTWTELGECLDMKVHVNTNFQILDITDPVSWKIQRKFLQANLFTMSFFASEIYSLRKLDTVKSFWSELFSGAESGSLFLYSDNGHSCFNDYIDEQWNGAGLERVIGDDNMRFIPRYSEQASDLGEYLMKFGQSPRIQGTVTYRVLRKQ
jgi:hypothetical protein